MSTMIEIEQIETLWCTSLFFSISCIISILYVTLRLLFNKKIRFPYIEL